MKRLSATIALSLALVGGGGCSQDDTAGVGVTGFQGLPVADAAGDGLGGDAALDGAPGVADSAAIPDDGGAGGADTGEAVADTATDGGPAAPDATLDAGSTHVDAVDAPDAGLPDTAAPPDTGGASDAGEGPDELSTPVGCSGLDMTPATPTPAAPCGADLQTVTGAVAPALGEVPCPGDYGQDPTKDGLFGVIEAKHTIPNPAPGHGPIEAKTYAPSVGGPIAPGPLPLVLVLHGFSGSLTSVEAHSRNFASHGFAVVAITFPNSGFLDPPAHDLKAQEAIAAIDWALSPASPFTGKVDGERIAVAGHSLGGKIAFYAAAQDPRVDVVIGWDPNNAGGPPCIIDKQGCNAWPVAPNCESGSPGLLHLMHAESLVFAAEDGLLTADDWQRAVQFYRGAPSPAHLVHFAKAGHMDWTFDNDVSALSRGVGTALLLRRFYGYTGLDAWLPPGGSKLVSTSLVDQVLSK